MATLMVPVSIRGRGFEFGKVNGKTIEHGPECGYGLGKGRNDRPARGDTRDVLRDGEQIP